MEDSVIRIAIEKWKKMTNRSMKKTNKQIEKNQEKSLTKLQNGGIMYIR